MNELINLMYQIKDLSTRTNEIALIDLQPRLMAVYDKLEIERLSICDVSNRLEEVTCAKAEPLIIEMNKDHLVELYNFAYEQALKTGKVEELKEIDAKLNGC